MQHSFQEELNHEIKKTLFTISDPSVSVLVFIVDFVCICYPI